MMKKLMATVALVVFATSAMADDVCKKFGDLAESVMEARQKNVPVSEMMKIMNTDPDFSEIGKMIVIEAYNRPAFSTYEYQSRAIASFRNDMELVCYSAK